MKVLLGVSDWGTVGRLQVRWLRHCKVLMVPSKTILTTINRTRERLQESNVAGTAPLTVRPWTGLSTKIGAGKVPLL